MRCDYARWRNAGANSKAAHKRWLPSTPLWAQANLTTAPSMALPRARGLVAGRTAAAAHRCGDVGGKPDDHMLILATNSTRAKGSRHGLVGEHRHHRRNGGARPHHVSYIPGVDLGRQLPGWWAGSGLERPRLYAPAVCLRACPRIWSHPHGAAIWGSDARRHLAADWR